MRTLPLTLSLLLLSAVNVWAGDTENRALYDLLAKKAPASAQAAAVRKHFSGDQLRTGAAVAAHGGDFAWALESDHEPYIYIDDKPLLAMRFARRQSLGPYGAACDGPFPMLTTTGSPARS